MKRAVFLDRDGVINPLVYNAQEGGLDSPYRLDQFRLLPGVGPALRSLKEMGFLTVVVSNQPGVAKGKCSPGFLEALNWRLAAELRRYGAALDAIYYCLHHPQGKVPGLRRACLCRKPRPGLLLEAAQELGIDLRSSYMVGDRKVDIEAGLAAGCTTLLVGDPPDVDGEEAPLRPHWVVPSLREAVAIIHDRG